MTKNRFTIHGTRGTMPVAGRQFARYGTQTTCFSLRTPQGLIVVDAGTGIISLSESLQHETELPPITMFFTHFHLDHVIGLPLFQPIYQPQARITMMGDPDRPGGWKRALTTLIGKPYWPVDLLDQRTSIRLQDLPAGRFTMLRHGIRIAWCQAWHPQQCMAYRLESNVSRIVIATDHETGNRQIDENFLSFCRGADMLIMDAQYTPRELTAHRGWGHGSWLTAATIAREAQVGELILTHHDRYRTDAHLDAIVRKARRLFPRTRASREGMSVAF